MNGDIPRIIQEIFVDRMIYAPVLGYLVFLWISYKFKLRKKWLHWIIGIGIGAYVIIAGIFVNHMFVHTTISNVLKKPGRLNLAVLCFYNVSRDSENERDCSLFMHSLTTNMRRISGKYGIDLVSYNEIINANDLNKNISLVDGEAVRIGRNFATDYVILGEISPIKDISVAIRVLNTDSEKKVLEFEMRRRVKRISSLARKASEEILYNLRDIPKAEKNVIHNRLSAYKTTIGAEKFFSEGLDEFHRGNYTNSVSALKKAIEEDENFSDPHYLLAFIYFSQKKDQLAIRELEATIKIEPGWADPYYFLGVVLKRNGRYEEAHMQYKKAVEIEKRLVYKMIYKTALAGALFKMGEYIQAEEIIREVEETQTKNKKVLYNLAARYCELNQLDKALSLLQEAIDSGLSGYDCKAALADPDFDNFRHEPTKFNQFQQMLKKCK